MQKKGSVIANEIFLLQLVYPVSSKPIFFLCKEDCLDLALNTGKPLGFLNPFLYKHPAVGFHDVTRGMNNENYRIGFSAIAGWDAASGLGTPDFAALARLV